MWSTMLYIPRLAGKSVNPQNKRNQLSWEDVSSNQLLSYPYFFGLHYIIAPISMFQLIFKILISGWQVNNEVLANLLNSECI